MIQMKENVLKYSWMCWAIVPTIFVLVSIWYQFGFSLGPMLEEWDLLYLMQEHRPFWNSFPGNTLSELTAARPLDILPFFFANYLSPKSFIGLHILLMLACALRMIGSACIGYYLFRNRFLAATLSMMSLVYPADTQQFEFRTMHINLAVGMMVFSAALTIFAFTTEPPLRRWVALVASVTLSCMAVLIYEPVAPLYAIAPLILLARMGCWGLAHSLRSRKGLVCLYLVGPAINALYLYYAIAIYKSSYQVNASQGSITNSIGRNLHYLIDSAAYRIFYDAWVSAWDILVNQTAHYGFLTILAIVLVGGLAALTGGRDVAVSQLQILRCFLVGTIIIIVGYAPFMAAESHMMITQRTFMGTAFGSALIVTTFLAFLCSRAPVLGTLFAAFLIFTGLVSQIYQFDRYNRDYTEIVLPYTSILADKADPSKEVHLVIDKTGFGGHLNGMYVSKISYAPIVRGRLKNTRFFLCMDGPLTPYMTFSTCNLSDGTWKVGSLAGGNAEYAQGKVQVIELGPNLDQGYRSKSGLWHDYGSFSPATSIFLRAAPDSYHCIADGMWGYSGFCRGRGWSDGIFYHGRFLHEIFVAALVDDPTLLIPLSPKNENYRFRITMHSEMNAENASKVGIEVNGHPIYSLTMKNLAMEAEVPQRMLKEGLNEITFRNALPTGQITGLLVSRFDLVPVSSDL